MRSYWNNTNQSVTYKVWTVDVDLVTYNNVKFLTSNNIKATIVNDDPNVIDWSGKRYRYDRSLGRVEFETTCEEQESMLKLVYGKSLLLLIINVVTPYSIVHSPV